TGNCKTLAEQFQTSLTAKQIQSSVCDMAKMKVRQLSSETAVIFICSTHGDGDPPETIHGFYDELKRARGDKLAKLNYAVLALGDSSYEQFCQTGKDIDAFLEAAGAKRIKDRIDCDVDFEKPSQEWLGGLIPQLNTFVSETKIST